MYDISRLKFSMEFVIGGLVNFAEFYYSLKQDKFGCDAVVIPDGVSNQFWLSVSIVMYHKW